MFSLQHLFFSEYDNFLRGLLVFEVFTAIRGIISWQPIMRPTDSISDLRDLSFYLSTRAFLHSQYDDFLHELLVSDVSSPVYFPLGVQSFLSARLVSRFHGHMSAVRVPRCRCIMRVPSTVSAMHATSQSEFHLSFVCQPNPRAPPRRAIRLVPICAASTFRPRTVCAIATASPQATNNQYNHTISTDGSPTVVEQRTRAETMLSQPPIRESVREPRQIYFGRVRVSTLPGVLADDSYTEKKIQ